MTQYLEKLLDDPSFAEEIQLRIEHFAPGALVIEEGGMSRNVYLIVKGSVHVQSDVMLDEKNTKDVGIAKLSERDLFGELSMFDDMPHNASVVAQNDCEIAVIDSQALNRYLDSHPEIGYRVMREIVGVLVKRMRSNNVRSNSILGWYLRESGEQAAL